MKKINVNNGRTDARFDIAKVEEKYNATFVGQFALKTRDGGWSADTCGDVYWQATPPNPEYSNYFALIMQDGTAYITSGASAVEGVINGVIAEDGEVIYSRYRHDFRISTDGTAWVDGGRDYMRHGGVAPTVQLKIVNGEFYSLENSDLENGTGGLNELSKV